MSFLAPWFLLGAGALAVPILVHLIHKERKNIVVFPSLMFVQRIPYKSLRRNHIRDWMLFALRCLAILLLVAAFARPLVDSSASAAPIAVDGAREVVVLLDRSYSMGYADRWDRARAAARRTVDGLGPQDRATLVLFADKAEAVTGASTEPSALTAAIDAATLGSGRTRYGPALKLAQGILEESDLPRREVVLITDFQKIGWDGDDDVRLPERTTLTHVDLSDEETSNTAVTGVTLQRDFSGDRERVGASARLTNTGAQARTLRVVLELNGRPLETREVSIAPNAAASATFEPFALPSGISRGTIRAGTDALPHDNLFRFVLSAGQALSVLVVEQADAPASRSLYLRRALGLGDRPPIRTEVRKAGQVGPADLRGRALVILNDVAIPGGALGRALHDFVNDGGGLLVALGERTTPNAFGEAAVELLPATIGSVVDRTGDRGATLAFLDYTHPAFELFSAPRSGDFSSARFYRYRAVTARASEGVLARFDDGGVALAERRVGAGRVLLWTSSLDNFWTDLAVQPVYLPMLHQLAKHASGFAEARPWVTVGQVVDIAPEAEGAGAAARAATTELVVDAPLGESRRLAPGESRLVELTEQGFYEVRRIGARPGTERRVIAVNLDLAESDLSALDPQEMTASLARPDAGTMAQSSLLTLTPVERERRQSLWWFLLAAALIALGAETILANRLSRKAA
ncbi:MAG TPA: BatA domain-containing protein [Gemmatimonadaceae bacterium]|nr:BatA domain-containing protein [Gemmatimonadaceae bacterium]